MSDDYLPLNLWIYFGLSVTGNKASGYTHGLKEFGKAELEILDSGREPEEIRAFLFNIAHYILENDTTFEDGQTIGLTEDEKILIKRTPGRFAKGSVWNLDY